jgi:two-component sensor histidine kinase
MLHHHVAVHNALTRPEGPALVDAADQLRKLRLALSRSKLDRMNIRLTLSTDAAPLEANRCWMLIMAVYEMVTNATRHACFDGREGEIKIRLIRSGSWVNCRVTDNGSGLGRIKPGRGLRIIAELAASLGGRIDHSFGTTHTSFAVDFPLTMREQHANRVIAVRRPRSGRRIKPIPPLSSGPMASESARAVPAQHHA